MNVVVLKTGKHSTFLQKSPQTGHFLPGKQPIDKNSPFIKQKPLIVQNIGAGQVMEDCLFNFTIIGHYRYKKL